MQTVDAPPIPVITTSCRLYQRILMAEHVIIVAEGRGEGVEPAAQPYFSIRQCLLSRPEIRDETEMLRRMVGG